MSDNFTGVKEHINGDKEWWVDDKRHRVDGPAVEWSNGSKHWYVDGKRHRVDGPAIEYKSGDKSWYVDGKKLTEEQFNKHPKVLEYIFNSHFDAEVEEVCCE